VTSIFTPSSSSCWSTAKSPSYRRHSVFEQIPTSRFPTILARAVKPRGPAPGPWCSAALVKRNEFPMINASEKLDPLLKHCHRR
jgi:hypothetical protein